MYLLNAFLALRAGVTADSIVGVWLERVGAVLFLIGSVIDAVLSYYYGVNLSYAGYMRVNYFNLTSAILWQIDSVLYIIADGIPTRKPDNDNFDESILEGTLTHPSGHQVRVPLPLNDQPGPITFT